MTHNKTAHDKTKPTTVAVDWMQAFTDKSSDSFAAALAEDVVLEASVLTRPISGRPLVKQVMAVASQVYEFLIFTRAASEGSRTYLEWEATAFGGLAMSGVTVIASDEDGRIARLAIHHRPLGPAIRFSAELRDRLAGTVAPDYFG